MRYAGSLAEVSSGECDSRSKLSAVTFENRPPLTIVDHTLQSILRRVEEDVSVAGSALCFLQGHSDTVFVV